MQDWRNHQRYPLCAARSKEVEPALEQSTMFSRPLQHGRDSKHASYENDQALLSEASSKYWSPHLHSQTWPDTANPLCACHHKQTNRATPFQEKMRLISLEQALAYHWRPRDQCLVLASLAHMAPQAPQRLERFLFKESNLGEKQFLASCTRREQLSWVRVKQRQDGIRMLKTIFWQNCGFMLIHIPINKDTSIQGWASSASEFARCYTGFRDCHS